MSYLGKEIPSFVDSWAKITMCDEAYLVGTDILSFSY